MAALKPVARTESDVSRKSGKGEFHFERGVTCNYWVHSCVSSVFSSFASFFLHSFIYIVYHSGAPSRIPVRSESIKSTSNPGQ